MAVLLLAFGPAAGTENPFSNAEPGRPAAAQAAPPAGTSTRVMLSRETCARLARHSPSADVAYRPGVDVHGRPVAPADVPDGFRVEVPDQIAFDVVIAPLRGGPARFGDTQMAVGRVEYDFASGVARLNGQPLADAETVELSQRCQRVLRGGKD